MKLACVDKTASNRLELQRLVSSAFDSSREVIGHLSAVDFLPTTREEILVGGSLGGIDLKEHTSFNAGCNSWAGVILGPGYAVEELFAVASEIRASSQAIPIFCFIPVENYSIRILRRLERITVEVFRTDDSPARVVHSILKSVSKPGSRPNGKLVALSGAKGGQGTSSIAVGIAHAAAAEGKSAIVVDLSKEGSLFHYLQCHKWQSSEYRTLLVDRLNPTKAFLERLIVEAPNGVKLLLPPAGGAEIRDLWIRSPHSFEISLSLIEILKEQFDLVIVDLAHSEGILPFSILTRADVRLLVALNEPAAVHLLSDQLTELRELPVLARTVVLLNLLVEHSLTPRDIEDFLSAHESASSIELLTLPRDESGANWIGTGNSIFTEGSRRLQTILRGLAEALCSGTLVQPTAVEDMDCPLNFFQRLSFRVKPKKAEQPLLPAPETFTGVENVNFVLTDDFKESFRSVAMRKKDRAKFSSDLETEYQSPQVSKVRSMGG